MSLALLVCDDILTNRLLAQGEYFGERALLMDEPRAANVIAKTNVSLMALDRQDFENRLGHGHLRSMIDYNMGIRVLQCVSIFKTLSSSEREKVFSALERVSFKKGATIVREGQSNNTFYIIKDGLVKVSGGGLDDTELGAGEWFGDEELRSRSPSSRTYTAGVRMGLLVRGRAGYSSAPSPLYCNHRPLARAKWRCSRFSVRHSRN